MIDYSLHVALFEKAEVTVCDWLFLRFLLLDLSALTLA